MKMIDKCQCCKSPAELDDYFRRGFRVCAKCYDHQVYVEKYSEYLQSAFNAGKLDHIDTLGLSLASYVSVQLSGYTDGISEARLRCAWVKSFGFIPKIPDAKFKTIPDPNTCCVCKTAEGDVDELLVEGWVTFCNPCLDEIARLEGEA